MTDAPHLKKVILWETSENYPLNDFLNKLDDTVQLIPKDRYPQAFVDLERDYFNDDDSSTVLRIGYWRPETPEEEAARMELFSRAQIAQEQRERAELSRLKIKYETPTVRQSIKEAIARETQNEDLLHKLTELGVGDEE